MNSLDLIRLAFKNFMRRKIRTFLTILGVIIGTAAIVVMLSLGIGMNESFKKEISRMGSLNVITVTPYYFSEEMMKSGGQPTTTVLDDKGVEKLSKLEGVEAVMPQMQASLKIVSGKYTTYGNIMGIDPSVMDKFDFKLAEGRLLTKDDTDALLFGSTTPMNFYNAKSSNRFGRVMYFGGNTEQKPPVDVLKDKLVMTFDMSYGERRPVSMIPDQQTDNKPPKLYKVKGIGLLAQSQNEKDYTIYMNINYLKKLIRENSRSQDLKMMGMDRDQGYQQVLVKIKDINDVQKVQKQINQMGYGAQSLADILKSMQKTAGTIQAVLGGIGAISLLVAALGITNTMIMSIFERTREIGIMKVLGCLLGDIRKLFLMEAGMIGFLGGVVGLLFSLGASCLLNIVGGGLFNGGLQGTRSRTEQHIYHSVVACLILHRLCYACRPYFRLLPCKKGDEAQRPRGNQNRINPIDQLLLFFWSGDALSVSELSGFATLVLSVFFFMVTFFNLSSSLFLSFHMFCMGLLAILSFLLHSLFVVLIIMVTFANYTCQSPLLTFISWFNIIDLSIFSFPSIFKESGLMNLKTVYHYTYFIYPFLVTRERYRDFLGKFIKDTENWTMTIHDSEVDLNTHAYFLPYVKKFIFPTLYWKRDLKQQFRNMGYKKKLDILSGLTSVTFKYKLEANCGEECRFNNTAIGIDIDKIELICFEPGICFLIIKTELDSSSGLYSNDVLDFNYKFRTVNPRYQKKKKTEGIFLKNIKFDRLEDFSSFIESLLYGFEDVEKENIYFDRLFTYSYMCLDEKEWNEKKGLNDIINEFYKFQYVLPGNYGSTFDPGFLGVKDNTYVRWKYSIYGFSRESGVVFASESEKFNSTKLPGYFENMYFYIFLLAFYQRIALIIFSQELLTTGGGNRIEKLKVELAKFTHFSWFSQITNSEQGMDIWKKWQKAFDLPALFDEVQKEYSEFYEYTVARGQERINLFLVIVFVVSAVFSGLAVLSNLGIIKASNEWVKVPVTVMVAATVLIFPLYFVVKSLKNAALKFRNND